MDAKTQHNKSRKAKFSFAGATLFMVLMLPSALVSSFYRKIYKDLDLLLAVMLGTALSPVILLAVCFAETAGYFNKMVEPSSMPRKHLVTLSDLT